jgi:hypothetical protein
MLWHKILFVVIDIFTVFEPYYSYLDWFIMCETICLSVENVEILDIALLLGSLSLLVVQVLPFFLFLRKFLPW